MEDAKKRLEKLDSIILAFFNGSELKTTSIKVPKKLFRECRRRGYTVSTLARIALLLALLKPRELARLAEEALRDAIGGEIGGKV